MRQNHSVTAAGMFIVLASAPAIMAGQTVTLRDFAVPGLVSVQLQDPPDAGGAYVLKNDERTIPAQVDTDGRLWWYQPTPCTSGAGCSYTLLAESAPATPGIRVKKAGDGLIEVSIDGQPFTAFNYADNLPKPFLYPVFGPTGATVTRHYPMKEVPSEPAKRRDHPHHRSLWTAHGDVRTGDFSRTGVDYWAQDNDPTGKRTKGIEKVSRIVRTVSGPVFGLIEADIDWIAPSGEKQLTETRTYRFYKTSPDNRVIDARVVLKFSESDVMFGDTKESGILSLRIATSMDEVSGGKMVNSRGQTGMKECWGKEAEWCDYVGQVEGQTLGIAVFDARSNLRHPTRWHIRDYGLYTANPFGTGTFTGKKDGRGSKSWKKGETEEFNYRILIHKGDTQAAKVAEQYRVYAEPAKVTVK